MLCEILQKIQLPIKSFGRSFTTIVFDMDMYRVLLCFLLLKCGSYFLQRLVVLFCVAVQRIIQGMKSLLQNDEGFMDTTRMPRMIHLPCIRKSLKMMFFAVSASFMLLSIYYSLYEDAKASVLSFLGVALIVWITRYPFLGNRNLNHPFLITIEFISCFLIVSGTIFLIACDLWTTGIYLACLGKVIEKYSDETRNLISVSRAYLNLNYDESSQNNDVETFDDLEISQANNISANEFDRVFLKMNDKIHQLELHNFLQLEDCNQTNTVINRYFNVLAEIQRLSKDKGLFQMHNMSHNVDEFTRVIDEFAEMLEASKSHQSRDYNEVRLEDCNEINLLVNEFVRHTIKIHIQFADDQTMDPGVVCETSLLFGDYVQLINDFIRQLATLSKSEDGSLVDETVGNEIDEAADKFQLFVNVQPNVNGSRLVINNSVEEISKGAYAKTFEKESIEISNLESLEENRSVDEFIKDTKAETAEDHPSETKSNVEYSDEKETSESLKECISEVRKSERNVFIFKANNKVLDYNEMNKAVNGFVAKTNTETNFAFNNPVSTISFNSETNKELVKKCSLNTNLVKGLPASECKTIKHQTEILSAGAIDESQFSPNLSCVEGVVNRIDVRFIYGLP